MTSESTSRRHRSPQYPYISLPDAIDLARKLYRAENRHAAPVDVVVGHWGYKISSSSGLKCVAATKYFGLIVDEGSGGDRKVKLSELALNILLDERENSEERQKLIQQAALKPVLHQELWEKWGVELPSDASFRTYLLRDRSFNETAVTGVMREYKDTFEFARLDQMNVSIGSGDQQQDEGGANDSWQESSAVVSKCDSQQRTPPADQVGVRSFNIPLKGGKTGVLVLPMVVDVSDLKRIAQWIDLMEDVLVEQKDSAHE